MTPTLTNAQKYSPEWGFEPGVVVEIHTDDGEKAVEYFNRIGEDYITCTNAWHPCPPDGEYGEDYHPILYGFDEIKSIRILSGPWSIWNFAPKGAVGCLYAENARTPVMFYKHPETFAIDKLDPDMDGDFMSPPWWWLEGQK